VQAVADGPQVSTWIPASVADKSLSKKHLILSQGARLPRGEDLLWLFLFPARSSKSCRECLLISRNRSPAAPLEICPSTFARSLDRRLACKQCQPHLYYCSLG